MKRRKPDKSHFMPTKEYHRKCHVVYTSPVKRTTRHSNPHNMQYVEYIESDDNTESECSTQMEYPPEEFQLVGQHVHKMKLHYSKQEPVASKRGYDIKEEEPGNSRWRKEVKQFYPNEESVTTKRDYKIKQLNKQEEPCNSSNDQEEMKQYYTLEEPVNSEYCLETKQCYRREELATSEMKQFNTKEEPNKGRHGHEIKQTYKHAEPIKGRRGQDMKHEKNIREKSPKGPQRVVECYRDSNYYNSPIDVDMDIKETTNTAIPIKKLNFDIPEEKPQQDPVPDRMDWIDYHRLDVIHKFMDDLEYDFPSLCTTGSIGTSIEGRNLKILKISNSNANNVCVWMDAGIHAREWIAPAVNTYIADHIVRNFDQLPESIRNKDWFFLPVVNPDGYEYSHTVDRMWRKNRAWHGSHCVGVDLNRNFSLGWGGKGSSDQPTNAFYRGPKPFSEPESSAIRDMFLNSGVTFKVYITLHSYGQIIIFPYACSSQLAPDYVRLLEGATTMSKAIFDTNGNTYKVGISRDVMYGAAGTSNDFSHGIAGIPYCYLIELRSKKHKFRLPKEEIEETGNEILNCVIALMEFVDNYKPKPISAFSKNQDETEEQTNTDFNTDSNINTKESIEKTSYYNEKRSDSYVRRANSHLRDDSYRDRIDSYMNKNDSFVNPSNCILKKTDSCTKSSDYFMREDIIAINIWKEERSTMDIMVEGPRAAQVAGMLHEREIPFSIAVPDVNTMLEKEQGHAISKRLSTDIRRTMDWKNFHRLDTIYAFMNNLAAEYPYLCTVSVIGKSVEGRDLKMLKISNGNSSNTGVWLDGAIHPREWISPAVVTYIADRIVRTFHEQPDSVTNKDWYILPVMNPDGYEYTHTHDRMWRKNRARYGECVGVDLNRNFSYGFGEKGEEGSSDDPGNIFYRGPKAFSEPETAAVKRVILDSQTTFKVYLSFHSYGEVIIFPWGYTSEPCPEYVELLEGGTVMAKAIHSTNGHIYKVGSTKDLMYYAAGTSTDWSYGVANIPYSYMVELRGKTHRFLLPKEEIVSTAAEVLNGVLRLMDFVDRRCTGTQSCVCPK